MDDTENTESQTNETNESQTDNTTDSQTDDTNDSQTNDTNDTNTNNTSSRPDDDWVDMHAHYDWGADIAAERAAEKAAEEAKKQEEEDKITVDDVFNNDNEDSGYSTDNDDSSYSTGETNNQSRTENQGDYDTSSKENSNVQTTTIGKQDEITTTPDTITENKGVISNSNIQSVEGLDFQQKDKDDLNSKKERDKAEAEDKSEQLKNELRNEKEQPTDKDTNNQFQVGNRDEEVAAAKAKYDEADKEYKDLLSQLDDRKAELDSAADNLDKAANDFLEASKNPDTKAANDAAKAAKEAERILDETKAKYDKYTRDVNNAKEKAEQAQKDYNSIINNKYGPDTKTPETPATKEEPDVPEEKPEIKEDTKIVPEELPPEEKPEVPEVPEEKPEEKEQELVDPTNPAQKAKDLEDKANSLRNKNDFKDEREREEANDLADSYDNLAASMKNAAEASKNIVDENGKVDLNKCTPQQIETWEKAQAQLSKNLNDALSKSRAYEQHYGNKQFTRDIAKANDFKVPGTDKTYAELATEMATKSPQIAQAMYEAKADRYKAKAEQAARDGHKVSAWFNNTLSKIESIKANMSQSFIGSKLTFADNKVRDQFNKMADLNMKATYAAYNNRLNHPEDYQPEDLEEARQQIDQAHALQYASAALKASTGALSGLGDSIKDGVYGTTNAKDLSGYQQVLADIGAFSQIVLGMGVSSLANKGYNTFNNLYPGSLFSKDIDKDGFSWTEEYGNNPTAEAILSIAQLSYGVSLVMNPMTFTNGISMIKNSIQNGLNAAYGVRNDARKLANLTDDITSYFEDVKEKPGIPPEAIPEIDNAINEIKTTTTSTENFKINSDEIGNLDNWLEGSGSNTADNGKFNQKLSYEDWLKLIQADPAMQEYAKKLAAEKNKNAQENNADTRVNS